MTDVSLLRGEDILRVAAVGLRTRPARAILSALGITIGIASMVSVLGLSESSKSDLIASLDRLGTNLIVVEAGSGIGFGTGTLTESAEAMVSRIAPVQAVSAVGSVEANVYRNDLVPESRSGGISVRVAAPSLLETLGATLADGRFLDGATDNLPVAVLGSVAAERLGLSAFDGSASIWLGGRWFGVVGVLDPIELAPTLDRSVLIGEDAAAALFDYDGIPDSLYVRAAPEHIDAVIAVLPATADPKARSVEVSAPPARWRPAPPEGLSPPCSSGSGSLHWWWAGRGRQRHGHLGAGAAGEIGLRRSLGATRRHVALQFVGEARILAVAGGLAGVALGAAVTAVYAAARCWTVLVPAVAIWGGITASILIGGVAGLYPSRRAARRAPTEALRSA
jgi:putative ABC transport system permease protein